MNKLPTVNSISGGKSSAYLAINYPADFNVFALVRVEDKKCLFPDKKLRQKVEDKIQKPFIGTAEMDEIIYTIFDLEQYIGKEIKWVTGKTFEQIINKKGNYVPNMARRFCTTQLKIEPIFKYLYSVNAIPCIMQLGFRAGEENRLIKKFDSCNEQGFEEIKISISKHKEGRFKGKNKWEIFDFNKPTAPMIDNGIFKSEVNNFFKDKPIRFAEMNNCVGCFWRNEPLLNTMSKKQPIKFNWFIEQEEKSKTTFRTKMTYKQIKEANFTLDLEFSDFDECDAGYCGL